MVGESALKICEALPWSLHLPPQTVLQQRESRGYTLPIRVCLTEWRYNSHRGMKI